MSRVSRLLRHSSIIALGVFGLSCITGIAEAAIASRASLVQFKVGGTIQDVTGQPIPNVSVSANTLPPSGSSFTTTTDTNGTYQFILPGGKTYGISPYLSGYSFQPPSVTLTNLNANHSNINFTGASQIDTLQLNAVAVAPSTATADTTVNLLRFDASVPSTGGNGQVTWTSLRLTQSGTLAGNFITAELVRASTGQVIASTSGLTGPVIQWYFSELVTGFKQYFVRERVSAGSPNGTTIGATFTQATVAGPDLIQTNAPVFSGMTTITSGGGGQNFTVSGTMRLTNGAPMAGVLISVTGGVVQSTTTTSTGTYFFSLPESLNYILTPSHTGFTFQPPSIVITNLSTHLSNQNFTGIPDPVDTLNLVATGIAPTSVPAGGTANLLQLDATVPTTGAVTWTSLRLTQSGNLAGSFIRAELVNAATGQIIASIPQLSGTVIQFYFSELVTGSKQYLFREIPSASAPAGTTIGATFTQATVASPDLITSNAPVFSGFTTIAGGGQSFTVSGLVRTTNGAPIFGVLVSVTGGASQSTTTNLSGTYSFLLPGGLNYTITPLLVGFTFQPTSIGITNLSSDMFVQDFVGFPTSNPNLLLQATGIAPSSATAGSSPLMLTYVASATNGSATWTSLRLTPVGSASASAYGIVKLIRTSNGSVVASAVLLSGQYNLFMNEPINGTQLYRLSLSIAVGAPAGSTVGLMWTNATVASPATLTTNAPVFSGSTMIAGGGSTFFVGGTVRLTTGAPMAGVLISVTGGATQSTTTTVSGTYGFTLPGGLNYTITPSQTGISFQPTSINITNLSGNLFNQDFVGSSISTPMLLLQAAGIAPSTATRGSSPLMLSYSAIATNGTATWTSLRLTTLGSAPASAYGMVQLIRTSNGSVVASAVLLSGQYNLSMNEPINGVQLYRLSLSITAGAPVGPTVGLMWTNATVASPATLTTNAPVFSGSTTIVAGFGALALLEPFEGFSNYPNPFHSDREVTNILYTLPNDSQVTMRFFTVTGELIRTNAYELGSTGGQSGTNQISWDGTNDQGIKVASGTYLCMITSGGKQRTRKIEVMH